MSTNYCIYTIHISYPSHFHNLFSMSVLQVHQFQVFRLLLSSWYASISFSDGCHCKHTFPYLCIYSCNNDVELYMKTPPLRIPFCNWLIFYPFTVQLESMTCIIKSEPKSKGWCIKL